MGIIKRCSIEIWDSNLFAGCDRPEGELRRGDHQFRGGHGQALPLAEHLQHCSHPDLHQARITFYVQA